MLTILDLYVYMYVLEHILSGLEFIKIERRSAMNSLSLLVVTAFSDEKSHQTKKRKRRKEKYAES